MSSIGLSFKTQVLHSQGKPLPRSRLKAARGLRRSNLMVARGLRRTRFTVARGSCDRQLCRKRPPEALATVKLILTGARGSCGINAGRKRLLQTRDVQALIFCWSQSRSFFILSFRGARAGAFLVLHFCGSQSQSLF